MKVPKSSETSSKSSTSERTNRRNCGRRFGNGLTCEELFEIEERAHHSGSAEADTILRLAAALREAMQIEENALALLSTVKGSFSKKS